LYKKCPKELTLPKVISNESIFQAVIKVVSEKGYPGTSTKLMAEAAGISEITLYRKFETKAGTVKAAIKHLLKDENIKEAFRYSGDVHADLSRMVSTYLEMVKHYGHFLLVLMTEIPRSDELKDILEVPLELMNNFSSLIAIYQKEGVLVEEPVQRMVSSLLGPLMYEGTMMKAMNYIDKFQIDSDLYVERFLKGRLI
jgi:AcrR family transcriptional regulator